MGTRNDNKRKPVNGNYADVCCQVGEWKIILTDRNGPCKQISIRKSIVSIVFINFPTNSISSDSVISSSYSFENVTFHPILNKFSSDSM